jgi:hypothetical protein
MGEYYYYTERQRARTAAVFLALLLEQNTKNEQVPSNPDFEAN